MKKLLLWSLFSIFTVSCFGQDLWISINEDRIEGSSLMEREAMPDKFDLYQLNFVQIQNKLSNAPKRLSGGFSNVELQFPVGNGDLETFRIYNAPVVAEGLLSKYPSLNSYVGEGISNPLHTIRFSVTQFGLHAMLFTSNSKVIYIDTYTKDLSNYIVYEKSDLFESRDFSCQVTDEDDLGQRQMNTYMNELPAMDDGIFRTYRLAMACTIEYAAYHIAAAEVQDGTIDEQKEAVLAAMVVTMTRVNGIYERDMAVSMQLIDNNDDIIFITSDNFSNNNAGALINQSQTVIDNVIGIFNYDIGHTVSTGGGGLAQLNVPCTSSKARGITGSSAPVGDPYDVDYVAHEMGHQFGATHTFNNSCGGNRSSSTAVEPGSGSTIMAYAGICAPNVQSNSDDYFHAVSIAQMKNCVLFTATCSDDIANGNSAPVVDAGNDYTIPMSTPYVLEGTAVDADGDDLTYCWEQIDNEISSQPPVQIASGGPNYRSLDPVSSPKRYFPDLSLVLNGVLSSTWEVTPSVDRSLDFSLTVRDNELVNGGQTSRDDVSITVDGNVGPFEVTSQTTSETSWEQGTTETITWDVNSTNTLTGGANVDVYLSIDGGANFDILLVEDTPNDGSVDITVPDLAATSCRIMVKASDNIFYNVNSSVFAIGYTLTETCITYSNETTLSVPDGVGAGSPGAVVSNAVTISEDITVQSVTATVDATHTYIQDLVIGLNSPNGTQVLLWNRDCAGQDAFTVTFDDTGSGIVCANPTVGTYAPDGNLSDFSGESSAGDWELLAADYYSSDTGDINSWSITICGQVATLNNAKLGGIQSFNIYPNPNNGNFTLSMASNSGENIGVSIFDIRGRSVFAQEFSNSGSLTKNLNLTNVSSGVYLVKVSDGISTETKKIVIQ
ncbi:Por secretion system C-terminal sorting domain-containing protein [Pustulibacterium marinum]|uniref:Por secretion system C-terminal sorting domain-containing protein n=1 Tax=Pustulibacterium marinum TaxID=1224947 RepID=A0A1I7HHI7_9FLAO|nr:zinc-dependent metalloprotease family protein [Pustulibacterium marinum]SFU60131.1 Por secretion system C-terminal sorting domain-containing protein [Pustulibacterium marinum]